MFSKISNDILFAGDPHGDFRPLIAVVKHYRPKAVILLTHEAPSCHRHGFEELDLLAEVMGAKLIVHGHHHSHYNACLESGIRVCGAPLRGVVNINGSLVVGGKNGW